MHVNTHYWAIPRYQAARQRKKRQKTHIFFFLNTSPLRGRRTYKFYLALCGAGLWGSCLRLPTGIPTCPGLTAFRIPHRNDVTTAPRFTPAPWRLAKRRLCRHRPLRACAKLSLDITETSHMRRRSRRPGTWKRCAVLESKSISGTMRAKKVKKYTGKEGAYGPTIHTKTTAMETIEENFRPCQPR